MLAFVKAAAVLLALPLGTLAGQVPVVGGVLGGVREGTIPGTRKILSKLADQPHALATTPGKLRVVENSGVCETTAGVYQASGYGDITASKSIFFWFFAARSNPSTAPLAVWFNGGPGSSSMIGLFQEHGPCRINNASTGVTLNPESWNTAANMLYIDQPVGTGFSHGTESVGTSEEAAADVYSFLQIFFADSRFSKYAANNFAIWTESYGGHYGPTFAAYILDQNKAIANGTTKNTPIKLTTLGIGNGLTDPINQYGQYAVYAQSNPYHPLVSTSTISAANRSWTATNGCQAQITKCNAGGSDTVCSNAQNYCNNNILSPLAGNYDVYYVLSQNPDPYPPPLDNLFTSSFMKKVGAESTWQESNEEVYDNFASTGDWMRSKRPALETVINAGIRTVMYDGDADYICNYMGFEGVVNALNTTITPVLKQQAFKTWTVAGQAAGVYKTAGTFSYVRVAGAGHEVPAYLHGSLARGQAALQMFTQTMSNNSLSSTTSSDGNDTTTVPDASSSSAGGAPSGTFSSAPSASAVTAQPTSAAAGLLSMVPLRAPAAVALAALGVLAALIF